MYWPRREVFLRAAKQKGASWDVYYRRPVSRLGWLESVVPSGRLQYAVDCLFLLRTSTGETAAEQRSSGARPRAAFSHYAASWIHSGWPWHGNKKTTTKKGIKIFNYSPCSMSWNDELLHLLLSRLQERATACLMDQKRRTHWHHSSMRSHRCRCYYELFPLTQNRQPNRILQPPKKKMTEELVESRMRHRKSRDQFQLWGSETYRVHGGKMVPLTLWHHRRLFDSCHQKRLTWWNAP